MNSFFSPFYAAELGLRRNMTIPSHAHHTMRPSLTNDSDALGTLELMDY